MTYFFPGVATLCSCGRIINHLGLSSILPRPCCSTHLPDNFLILSCSVILMDYFQSLLDVCFHFLTFSDYFCTIDHSLLIRCLDYEVRARVSLTFLLNIINTSLKNGFNGGESPKST